MQDRHCLLSKTYKSISIKPKHESCLSPHISVFCHKASLIACLRHPLIYWHLVGAFSYHLWKQI